MKNYVIKKQLIASYITTDWRFKELYERENSN